MKTTLKYALAPAMVLALGITTASAQEFFRSVTVTGVSTTDVNINVFEEINKDKNVSIDVFADIEAEGAAESDVTAQQDSVGNSVTHDFGTQPVFNPQTGGPYPLNLDAQLIDAFNANSGIIQGNQDTGNMVNQGNAVAASITTAATAYSQADGSAAQFNIGNTVITSTFIDQAILPAVVPTKVAVILNSINGNAGVINVNQNAGNMNNQFNGVSMALADDAVVALSDANLGQMNAGNDVTETNTVKFDIIELSVNGNAGVTTVNQSTGNMNNQATMISFAGIADLGGAAP